MRLWNILLVTINLLQVAVAKMRGGWGAAATAASSESADDYLNYSDRNLSRPISRYEIERDVRELGASFDLVTGKRSYNGYELITVKPETEYQLRAIIYLQTSRFSTVMSRWHRHVIDRFFSQDCP